MLKYKMQDGSTSYEDSKRNTIVVANFEARIFAERRYIDTGTTRREYVIHGSQLISGQGATPLPEAIIDAEDFHTLTWVTANWGSQAIVYPAPSAREMLRTIIQLESKPEVVSIYTATGWVKIDGAQQYLTNGCAIGPKRRSENIVTALPFELRHIALPPKSSQEQEKAGVRASLAFSGIGHPEAMWAILAAVYRAPIAPSDFAVHITGRTGTFKSELAAIAQSHWGEHTARELPGSWSSTGNALESLAHKAKDALMVIDDFIPMGTSWQIKSYQKTADQLIRAQGNQAGRARLTDTSKLQQTSYPRGLLLSTGEDTPEGHSVRGRMIIAEMTPGDVKTDGLTKAQDRRHLYPHAMAAYVQWLAKDLKGRRAAAAQIHKEVRDAHLNTGHSRTPSALGHMVAGVYTFLQFACEREFITPDESVVLSKTATDSLLTLAGRQIEYLMHADPAEQFIGILRGIFAANAGHLKGMSGGIPRKATLLGWTSAGDGANVEWKPHGPRVGWAEEKTGTAYLEATVAYDTIRRHSRGAITITRQTLYKRLREAGHLSRIDDARQRNTIRVTCEGAGRTVLALKLAALTEGEVSN